jgi:hypothetical protein
LKLEAVLAATSVSSGDSFEILDGVRRAKAAQMSGQATIPARMDDGSGALGPVVDLPIEELLSPKPAIDISSTAKFKRFKKRWTRPARDRRRRPSLLSAVNEGG